MTVGEVRLRLGIPPHGLTDILLDDASSLQPK